MFPRLNFNSIEVKKKRRKKIFSWVFSVHFSVLFCLFLMFSLRSCIYPKKLDLIQINLVEGNTSIPNPGPRQKTQQRTSRPEPLPEKKSLPKPEVKEKIAQPKPAVSERKITVPKKQSEKKRKYLDVNEITKSTTTTVIKKSKAAPSHNFTPLNSTQLAETLNSGMKKIQFGNTLNATNTNSTYYDQISQFLYDKWQQPSRADIGATNPVPTVRVKFVLDRNGRIISSSIISYSNISAMDNSVRQLLADLTSLPASPDGAIEFEVSLELRD